MKSAWLLLAFLAPIPVSANAPANGPLDAQGRDTFHARVMDVSRSAADPAATPGTIWEKGQNLYLNNVNIAVEPNLRGWDFGRDELGDGKEQTLADILTGGERALSDLGRGVPPPELRDAVAGTQESYRSGRVEFSDGLGAEQMGRFLFTEGAGCGSGRTQVNRRMSMMAGVMGGPLAYMTQLHEYVHEQTHCRGQLSAQRVVEGELPAFMIQYQWLAWIDPHGERVAYARAWLQNQVRRGRGGQLAADSLKYLDHAAEIRATDGDRRKMLELIEKLGYRDGHHDGDGHDHGGSEQHPTRA